MQYLAKKHNTNKLQEMVQQRKSLGDLKLRFEQDPSDLFEELSANKQTFEQTTRLLRLF